MLAPAQLEGSPGSLADAYSLRAKINELSQYSRTGSPREETLTESEINSYLAARMLSADHERVNEVEIRRQQESMRVRLKDDGRILIQWSRRVGPLDLVYSVDGRVDGGAEQRRFIPEGVRIGRLRIPGVAGIPLARRALRNMEGLAGEIRLLASATAIEIKDGRARIVFGPASVASGTEP